MNIVERFNLSTCKKEVPCYATTFNPKESVDLIELLAECLIDHEIYPHDYEVHEWDCMLFVLEDYTKNAKATGEEFVAIWFDNN